MLRPSCSHFDFSRTLSFDSLIKVSVEETLGFRVIAICVDADSAIPAAVQRAFPVIVWFEAIDRFQMSLVLRLVRKHRVTGIVVGESRLCHCSVSPLTVDKVQEHKFGRYYTSSDCGVSTMIVPNYVAFPCSFI